MSRQGSAVPAAALPPHVLIFPLPLQGHVNTMLNLAEILLLSDFHVTILLTDYIHDRLLRHAGLQLRFSTYPGFRVSTISDGLSDDLPRAGERSLDGLLSFKTAAGPQFRLLMESSNALSDGGDRRRVSCLIIDWMTSICRPVVEEMGIPYLVFRTVSACSFWVYFCLQEIIDAASIPIKGKDEDMSEYRKRPEMDLPVTVVPGMEGILRRRDIPGPCRVEDIDDPGFQTLKTYAQAATQAAGFILNTFEDLEGPILDQIRNHIPNVYTIGPLHTHLKARLECTATDSYPSSEDQSSSLWKEDPSCLAWLDSQPPGSVVYVSFGSITTLTRDELLEFWHGLVNSEQRFLWVIRPDSIAGDRNVSEIPAELEEGTAARGYMAGWVAQGRVLAHPAIGAFLTHSGWNSIIECIPIGLPLICWAHFYAQQTNSRFASRVWNLGVDIKDTCDRVVVEKAVRHVMQAGMARDAFMAEARAMSMLARKAISEEGSSYRNLNRLMEFLRS